jgi:hypothetical protein
MMLFTAGERRQAAEAQVSNVQNRKRNVPAELSRYPLHGAVNESSSQFALLVFFG